MLVVNMPALTGEKKPIGFILQLSHISWWVCNIEEFRNHYWYNWKLDSDNFHGAPFITQLIKYLLWIKKNVGSILKFSKRNIWIVF